jgi:hypothetical protein
VPEELARQYRGLVIFDPFSPVHPEEMRALEREIGQAIPPAYRRFLEPCQPRGSSEPLVTVGDR